MIAASPQSFLLGSGESGRAERLRGADRLRPGLCHLADPSGQKPDERRGADGEGELCSQHQVQEDGADGGQGAAGGLEDEGPGEEAAGAAGGAGGGAGQGPQGITEEAGQPDEAAE